VSAGKRIVVGVAGGIAAYKACTLVRQLTEAGHSVRVLPTESALRFVGAATFEALSGNPVHTGVFTDVHEVPHVRIGQEADLVVVAPATADLLARAVAGRADDLLTATLLTARCPVLFAPAMHTEMWFSPGHRRQRGHIASAGRCGTGTGLRAAHGSRQRCGAAT
jgi:phosphopantothenoylcysteine decarboxylase/phosphopantothenate--cysteine ligase